jgi:predicted CoA-binding protein
MTTPLTDPILNDLATNPGVVAVVGFSPRPYRPSHGVAAYLISQGITTYLVNPAAAGQSALGQTILASLADVPEHIHIVDIFRRPEEVLPIVEDAIRVKADAVWFQLDIINPDAIARARDAGLRVVVDRCLKVEHARLAHGG